MENDGVGLIAFAGSSYIQSPLTTDYSSIKTFLFSIDATTISRNGTEISRAIQLAIDHFSERMVDSRLAIEQRKKYLFLLVMVKITAKSLLKQQKLQKSMRFEFIA